MGACCAKVECHFEDEEKLVLQYLPPPWREWLLGEHARLEARGYPPDEVLAHAEEEMILFDKYVPAHIVRQIDAEHVLVEEQMRREALAS